MYKFFEVFKTLRLPEELGSYLADTEVTRVSKTSTNTLARAAPTTAPKLGSSLSDPIKMYLSDIYTISVNLAGLPGMTVPCGTDKNGLPVGMQLIGNCFEEKKLIQTAYTYEQSRKEN